MKLIELRHREMGLNMTYRDTQSQVQSGQKAIHIRSTHRGYGLSLIPKEV